MSTIISVNGIEEGILVGNTIVLDSCKFFIATYLNKCLVNLEEDDELTLSKATERMKILMKEQVEDNKYYKAIYDKQIDEYLQAMEDFVMDNNCEDKEPLRPRLLKNEYEYLIVSTDPNLIPQYIK